MKKLVLSLAAVAALAGTPGAWADAECQAGSAWGAKPGCGAADEPTVPRLNNGLPITLAQPGWYAVPYADGNNVAYPVDPRTGIAYPQHRRYNRNDRDGDGVRNSRDRYPDDARYR